MFDIEDLIRIKQFLKVFDILKIDVFDLGEVVDLCFIPSTRTYRMQIFLSPQTDILKNYRELFLF